MIRELAGNNLYFEIAIKVGIVGSVYLAGISLLAMFSIWWERKVAGHIQSRVGPMHTGGWHGWSQSIADGIKLILKEDLRPAGSDAFLFRLAPYLAFGPIFAAFLALPFGPQFIFENGLNIGVLYILAVLAVEVMATILAGWGSNSKWAIYGAMREACQMVSYEIPLGVALITGLLVAGTLNMSALSYLQGEGIWDWFVFHNPFTFGAFVIYFVASLASTKRAPFDLPESESELVAGYHTEYSGLRFSFFFFAEYAGMFIVGAIAVTLFLGGWNSPLGLHDPIYEKLLGYSPQFAGMNYFNGEMAGSRDLDQIVVAMGVNSPAKLFMLNFYCLGWFVVKVMGLVFVQMWLRWTLPRIRIDQVLYACVKVLLPASLIMLAGCAVWIWLVDSPPAAAGGVVEAGPYTAHLMSPATGVQLVTQIVLTSIGVLIAAFALAVVILAIVRQKTSPPKSLFTDIMPVGREIAFTRIPEPATETE